MTNFDKKQQSVSYLCFSLLLRVSIVKGCKYAEMEKRGEERVEKGTVNL
jgi:hypothetical protein